MQTRFRLLAVSACAGLLFGCGGQPSDSSKPVELTTDQQKFGYAVGVDLGNSLKDVAEHVDIAALKRGLDDITAGREPTLASEMREEAKMKVSKILQAEQAAEQAEIANAALAEAESFLAENGKKEGVKTTESGLQYEILEAGEGESPTELDTVTVHYVGTLLNGEEFDSSVKRGQPATFPLGGVIDGWTEGVQLMKPGAKFKFYIPPKLGYGERGAGAKIGPNALLVFEVELIEVQTAEKKEENKDAAEK